MTYAEAIDFLFGLRLFGANFGLENTFKLAALAGNPQAKLRFIHVAGTNGKGSTCAMLESIYRAAGYRTGLFTSPHLVSFRERLQVNRQLIPEDEVVRQVEVLRSLLQQFPAGQHPTFFEVVAVMALRYFADQQCDVVIWETGLGGRLDATNIVTPMASVITSIGFDHQQWLGETLSAIAGEKAGIIKPGVPVVTAALEPEAQAVMDRTARERNASLTRVAPITFPPGELALAGAHQQQNAAVALAVVKLLQPQLPVRPEHLRSGLTTVSWPGRLQLLTWPDGRKLLLDGAHNTEGVAALRTALQTLYGSERPVLIFGALQDKKWPELCALLAPLADCIHIVPVASERSAVPAEVGAAFRTANPVAKVTVWSGLREALTHCQASPFVVVTGSLYLVGEALEWIGLPSAGPGERGLNEWTTTTAHDRQIKDKAGQFKPK